MQVPGHSERKYRIKLRSIAPRRTLGIRAFTYQAAAPEVVRACVEEVLTHLRERDVEPTAAPFARFITYKADFLELEAGFTLPEPVQGAGRIVEGRLPGGRAAVTWHVGPYDSLVQAVNAGSLWSLQNGHQLAGPPWAFFWASPQEVPDAAEWKTEVMWPLK